MFFKVKKSIFFFHTGIPEDGYIPVKRPWRGARAWNVQNVLECSGRWGHVVEYCAVGVIHMCVCTWLGKSLAPTGP